MAKNLVKRLSEGVAVLTTGLSLGLASCKPLIFNFIPEYLLSAYQDGNNLGIVIETDVIDLNGKQDVVEYDVIIKDSNGIVIGNLSGKNPINQIISVSAGTFYISGWCVDSQGAIGPAGPVTVTLNAPPQLVFSGNLGVSSPLSGNLPLEKLVSFSETSTDWIPVKYEIGVDANNNGGLEDNEIIIMKTSAISNEKMIFTNPGVYEIYGRATRSQGNTGMSGPIEITVSPIITNPDLTGTITFPDVPYNAGGKLTFNVTTNNSTNPYSPITFDNSNRQMGYQLIKEIISGVGKEIFDKKLEENLKLTLKENGRLILKQRSDDKFDVSIANADVTYNGIGPILITILNDWPLDNHPCTILDGSGKCKIVTKINYSKGTENKSFIYLSESFNVN